jgi:exopolysaccharide production protein ExoQ
MPPPLALALTIVFVSLLLWRDFRVRARVNGALWLPVVWFFFVGSRYLTQWLSLWGVSVGGTSLEDGSLIDAVFFAVLTLAGLLVLVRRRVALPRLVRDNQWLAIFLLYSFLAITWSDFPFVALKRWIKELGHPIMALVVLSDSAPREALRTVLRRSSYLLIPPSILVIKYYPEVGRGFDTFTGAAINIGIMTSKNDLGYVCALFGLFFFWNFLSSWRIERARDRRVEIGLTIMFLWMIWWLLSMAQSSTSLVCTLIGAGTMVVVSTRLVSKRFIGTYLVVGLLILLAAESAFGLYGKVVEDVLGKEVTLTDRTVVWHDALALVTNPVFGAGFESFWLGPRLDAMWAKWWWQPTQAHNGYIETYLNLGWVGVAILVALIISTFRKARLELMRDLDFGRFRLGVLFAIVVYNYTEATFKALHPLWTLFYMIATDCPAVEPLGSEDHLARAQPRRSEVDRGFRIGVRQSPNATRVQRRTSFGCDAASTPDPKLASRRWR